MQASAGCGRQEPNGQTGATGAHQFVNEDLPAEWLPMSRHVILSRGGRILFARSSRSFGKPCACDRPLLQRLISCKRRARLPARAKTAHLCKCIFLREELGKRYEVVALHHPHVVFLIAKLAIIVDARGFLEDLLVDC